MGRGKGGEKELRDIVKHKLSVTKQMSHRHEMYSVGNIANNYVISLYGKVVTRLIVVIVLSV